MNRWTVASHGMISPKSPRVVRLARLSGVLSEASLLQSHPAGFHGHDGQPPGVDMDILDIVSGTDEAAFSVDHEGRIGAWNGAMSQLVGLKKSEVLNTLCHRVLCGLDPFGNLYCGKSCPVQRMVRRREPIRRFELSLQTAQCQRIQVCVSIIALRRADHGKHDIIHLLSPSKELSGGPESDSRDSSKAASRTAGSEGRQAAPVNRRMTRRELEVLDLLAAGKGTTEISELLFISAHTVRNHIQNILGKLEAHSRLEAVAFAQRLSLI